MTADPPVPRRPQTLFRTVAIYLNTSQTYSAGPLLNSRPHFQALRTPGTHTDTHTHRHTCPCKVPALPLSAGCLAAHWLHSSRPQIEADGCLCVYQGMHCLESACVCTLLVRKCLKVGYENIFFCCRFLVFESHFFPPQCVCAARATDRLHAGQGGFGDGCRVGEGAGGGALTCA